LPPDGCFSDILGGARQKKKRWSGTKKNETVLGEKHMDAFFWRVQLHPLFDCRSF
jgi:hypothetical protein